MHVSRVSPRFLKWVEEVSNVFFVPGECDEVTSDFVEKLHIVIATIQETLIRGVGRT